MPPPDAATVHAFLGRVARRLALLRALEGGALGLVAGSVLSVAASLPPGRTASLALASGLLGGAARLLLGDRRELGWWRAAAALADRVEERAPRCRNAIVAAAEVIDGRLTTSVEVERRLVAQAAALAGTLSPGGLFPARRAVLAFAAAGALAVAAVGLLPGARTALERMAAVESGDGITGIDVVVTPPPYTGRPADTLTDPERIVALAGSRVHVAVRAGPGRLVLETLDGPRSMQRDASSGWAEVRAAADDFLSLALVGPGGDTTHRRLVGLAVVPDHPPVVRITVPGRDLFVTTPPDSLVIVVEAEDDLALASLRLRYTAVSGSGEQFTFAERDVPLSLSRDGARRWSGRAAWAVGALRPAPGDVLVYHAEAADRRPGAPAVRSDAWVVEVVGAGAIASEGFAVDDERDRYAVSQQMVILRTERLIAQQRSLSPDALSAGAREVAAEQRRVRAEFLFMMGGELEEANDSTSGTLVVDETAEAEGEGDLLAGRLQNRGRVEMQRALRAMSRAAVALTEADVERALVDERAALDNLMRAFARSRYLLRALTRREALDLDRRLSGSLADAPGERRPGAEAAPEPRVVRLRAVLAGLAALAGAGDAGAPAGASALAAELRRIDPADDSLRALSERLAAVGRAAGAGSGVELEAVSLALARLVRRAIPSAPGAAPSIEEAALRGALADALRARGGGR